MLPGFNALTSLTGGGALTPSSNATTGPQHAQNDVATGNITVGGLNLMPASRGNSETIIQAAVIGALVLGGIWALKAITK